VKTKERAAAFLNSNDMDLIREYEDSDAAELEECFVELQDFELRLDAYLADSRTVVKQYLAHMFSRCAETEGKVFVAESEQRVAGFISVWAKVKAKMIEEKEYEYAYISDLVILPAYRGRGLGHALLSKAEEYARAAGATTLRIGVLAKNDVARNLYQKFGFADRVIEMSKAI
jgi:ribosomal protein S18 acetylase RimI-like enzyme